MTTHHSTLVTTETLAAHLDDPSWLVIDIRHDLADPETGPSRYAAGHIPGARFASMDTDLAATPGGGLGRHPLPDTATLEQLFQSWGINRDTQVVVYDDSANAWAGRLWWMLRYLGHDAVAVLDGGFGAWTAEGRPVSTESALDRAPGTFEACPRPELLASTEDVVRSLGDRSKRLVDSRAADRYRGENETIDPVAGHIPGARNRFFKANVDANGLMRTKAELAAEWDSLLDGVDPADAIVYCGSGVTACANLLAAEAAGRSGARLYAGSWSAWCSDEKRPIEIGDPASPTATP